MLIHNSCPSNSSLDGVTTLSMMILLSGSGRFEICESDVTVVTGVVRLLTNTETVRIDPTLIPNFHESLALLAKDIYKELSIRGYHYSGIFRGIAASSLSGRDALITWNNNYVVF